MELDVALLPVPRKVEVLGGRVEVVAEHVFRVAALTLSGQRLGDSFSADGVTYSVQVDSDSLAAEAYRLVIDEGKVALVGGSALGVLHGARTLRQWLQAGEQVAGGQVAGGKVLVGCVDVTDSPDIGVRGVMLDISRDKVPTMASLYALIDRLAMFKLNQFQLYMEHAFAYPGHEVVWGEASPITGDELRQLDAYCADRGIELVPNQNCFGHLARWLKHDEYKHLAEAPNGYTRTDLPKHFEVTEPGSLNPLDPASVDFVDGLLEELLSHLPNSKLINIGCDETFDLGQDRSKAACEAQGKGRVYLDFVKQINALVEKRGKRAMFWGDIILHHPELIADLPKDMIAVNWGYEADHPFDEECGKFAEAGVPFYVCPSTSSYVSIGGRGENAATNARNAAKYGLKHGAQGYLMTAWGDYGHWQPSPTVDWVGYGMGAAVSWCESTNAERDPVAMLNVHVFDDASGKTGEAIWKLGQVQPALGANRFCPYGWLMVRPDTPFEFGDEQTMLKMYWGDLGPWTEEGLARSMDFLTAARAAMAGQQMAQSLVDRQWIVDEFGLAADLLEHAIENAKARLRAKVLVDGELPAGDRKRLAEHMRGVVAEHRRLWVRRNRVGGLTDSLVKLEERLVGYGG